MSLKQKKLNAIENAALSIENGIHEYACIALEDIGGLELRAEFNELFRPKWAKATDSWTFHCTSKDTQSSREEDPKITQARILSLCLFYEVVRASRQ